MFRLTNQVALITGADPNPTTTSIDLPGDGATNIGFTQYLHSQLRLQATTRKLPRLFTF